MANKQYRTATFQHKTIGAYAQVYQRPNESPMVDLNFFEGGKDISHLKKLKKILDEALALAEKWENET